MTKQLEINENDVDRLLEFMGVDNAGGSIFNYQGKPFTGIIKEYDKKDQLIAEMEYMDGHPGGVSRLYYADGTLMEEFYENFGRLDKHYKKWDEEGVLIRHSTYDDGKKLEQIVP